MLGTLYGLMDSEAFDPTSSAERKIPLSRQWSCSIKEFHQCESQCV